MALIILVTPSSHQTQQGHMTNLDLDIEIEDDLAAVEVDMAREYLIDFTTYTNPRYKVKWFHNWVCDKIDAMLHGEIKNLMVFMPPQHGKTELVSRRTPALVLGKFPDTRIVCGTYASALAGSINRDVQRIMDTSEYATLFPDTRLGGKNVVTDRRQSFVRNSEMFEVVNHRGSFRSVGIGGSLSGFPVDFGDIDDPVKDMQEAGSETVRNSTWDWYNGVYRMRCHNDTHTMLTMTRWNEDDLAGRILQNETDWDIISLPYLKEEDGPIEDTRQVGEALWPEKHSAEKALQTKKDSERVFNALCQQRPAPAEGGPFKQNWFKYYYRMPTRFERIWMSWDCAFKDTKDASYVVGTIWGKIGADSYLLGMARGKWDFVETVKQIKETVKAFPYCQEKLVEDKANGTAVLSILKHEIPGLIPISPKESKESRAYAVSFLFEAGNIHFPANCSWVDDIETELKFFPNGRHNDIVDSISQALRFMYINGTGRMVHMSYSQAA
jgi:predicted phage terminase large subunit-like protein